MNNYFVKSIFENIYIIYYIYIILCSCKCNHNGGYDCDHFND